MLCIYTHISISSIPIYINIKKRKDPKGGLVWKPRKWNRKSKGGKKNLGRKWGDAILESDLLNAVFQAVLRSCPGYNE